MPVKDFELGVECSRVLFRLGRGGPAPRRHRLRARAPGRVRRRAHAVSRRRDDGRESVGLRPGRERHARSAVSTHGAGSWNRVRYRREGRGRSELHAGGARAGGGVSGKEQGVTRRHVAQDRKSTRLNSSHSQISYAVFCLKKKKNNLRTYWTSHVMSLTRIAHY